MPTLNISLPAIPVRPAGAAPVGASPVLSAGAVPGDGFAAMIAHIGTMPMAYGAAIAKPVAGTPLPPGRQDVAGDPQPLSDIDVEDVMLGALPAAPPPSPPPAPPSPAPAPPAVTPPADAEADGTAELPAPPPQPIECGFQIFAPHGPHGRGQVQPAQKQAPLLAPELPGDNVPDLAAVERDDDARQPDKHDTGGDPGQSQANSSVSLPVPPLAFAPVMWTKPLAAEPALPAAPDAKAAAAPAAGAAALPVQPASGQSASAAPVNRTEQSLPVAPPPVPVNAAAASPRGFDLPPDVAREVAELVRTATRKADESAPLPVGSDTAPAPSVQASAPLHRDFVTMHRPAIDTSRGDWLQTMIDRIAEMPQADGRREAQIRLLPDALGAIDVKIEQRQDRVHVTLNAESAQTRQLLTDATPRLHELAEARGLRLGQTGVGGGEQQDRRPAQEQQPAVPLRPRSASADNSPETESDGDLIA